MGVLAHKWILPYPEEGNLPSEGFFSHVGKNGPGPTLHNRRYLSDNDTDKTALPGGTVGFFLSSIFFRPFLTSVLFY